MSVASAGAWSDAAGDGRPGRRPSTRSGEGEQTVLPLDQVVRDLCQQIEHLAAQIPDEQDRAYAEVAQECLWTMYRRVSERAIVRQANKDASDGHTPARLNEFLLIAGHSLSSVESREVSR